jgi:peptidoglycan hydrolase CwlO-like protein
MSKEVSETKEKNNKLKKHVKFYQNQIKDLKKNLSGFERYFLQDVL